MKFQCSALAAAAALACTDDPAPTSNTAADVSYEAPEGTYRVDASSDAQVVRFDLDSREQTDTGWDLGFKRYQITSNGGVSGQGGVLVAALPNQRFDAVTQAPSDGWVEDRADGPDEGPEPDTAFLGETAWYDYDPGKHVLSPRETVYVVRTTEGAYVKLAVTGYYDEAGTAGFVAFRAAAIDAPDVEPVPVPDPGSDGAVDGSDGLVDGSDGASDGTDGASDGSDGTVEPPVGAPIAASDAAKWTRLVLASGETRVVADLAEEGAWDVAFQRTTIRCNGGVSGAGIAGARLGDADYDALVAAPTWGYELDRMVPNPGPPGSGESPASPVLAAWYDYDPATHAVSPKDQSYLVRSSDGSAYFKLAISHWDDGVFHLQTASVPKDTTLRTASIDATSITSWRAFSLRAGGLVEVSDLMASDAWDLAFSGALIRTNGGASGMGGGGAVLLSTPLEDVTAVTGDPVVDALAPVPGPPGSAETSQNAVLGGWFDYDPVAHTLSPKDATFGIWTADGGIGAIRIAGYEDGVYTLEWRYAGAGQTSL